MPARGIDVDLFLQREIRGKTIDRVAQRIRLNRTKLRELQDTSTDYEELASSIQAGYYIKHGLSSNNEDLFYMSVLITVSAASYRELLWRKQQISASCGASFPVSRRKLLDRECCVTSFRQGGYTPLRR